MFNNVFFLVIVVFIVFIILSWLVIVPEKQEVIVEMLGKYHKTMKAGVNFKLPLIQTIRKLRKIMFLLVLGFMLKYQSQVVIKMVIIRKTKMYLLSILILEILKDLIYLES